MVHTLWSEGDNEDGLLGFTDTDDLDRFVRGEPGPFKRNMSPDGATIRHELMLMARRQLDEVWR